MPAEKNRQIVLASLPSGEPTPDNFRLVETEVPELGSGQMLLRTIYLSLDPYMRGRMNAGPSYAKPVEVGDVMCWFSLKWKFARFELAGKGWHHLKRSGDC